MRENLNYRGRNRPPSTLHWLHNNNKPKKCIKTIDKATSRTLGKYQDILKY